MSSPTVVMRLHHSHFDVSCDNVHPCYSKVQSIIFSITIEVRYTYPLREIGIRIVIIDFSMIKMTLNVLEINPFI